MQKREHDFAKVQEYKERFLKEPTERLAARLRDHQLIKEAAIAIREVLGERGVKDDRSSD